ncbi:bestrophin family protein [Curvibacter sp. HBC61]|uniref:Bestrophin family protein n=1 Tax=Curvibacter cyanobacteriorum TaxID=3026422 RepID=A0ABT5N1L6_9BURK|nr:bestrophin family protein [Curvibacter sp. HBC61]MDD0839953.1 bestrophin family protein [Curvibacter sp. HBC61]
MIVRDRPSGLKLFWLMRGSILPRISRVLLFNIALATVVTLSHGALFHTKITLTAIPFTLIGLPLAIFLGFRNTAAYDRYWEARKLWGELLLRSRNLARQCLCHIAPPQAGVGAAAEPSALTTPTHPTDRRVHMVRRAAAFCHALRLLLRDSRDTAAVQAWLPEGEWAAVARSLHLPQALMMRMGADLAACQREGRVDAQMAVQIDHTLSALTAAAASCERIKSTPVPFSYTLLLHRTAYAYCFLLPFGLVDTLGFMTPLVVAIVAYTFFGLDALGDEIEEPFGLLPNDLPLDALCRHIEINLLESLGDTELPPPLVPLDYCLM